MSISVQMVKELREKTGAGVLDAKKALQSTDGNIEAAIDLLRKKGAARAEKRSARTANEGIIEMYSHQGSRIGVMIELNCETDFVARNENFLALAHDLALHVAAMAPKYLTTEEVPTEALDREVAVLREQALSQGKPENIVEKIVQGRLSKFYAEVCLLEQPFIKDESVTIKQLITDAIAKTGENIVLRRFVRYELGEEL